MSSTDSTTDFTTVITVDSSPADVLAAIADPRAWWGTDITGETAAVGDEFVFEVPGVHHSLLRVTEATEQRVVWTVVDATISFVADQDEWTGTEIRFDIAAENGTTTVRFTHVGLSPQVECYEACSTAWTFYAGQSLRTLLVTGTGEPGSNPQEAEFKEAAAGALRSR